MERRTYTNEMKKLERLGIVSNKPICSAKRSKVAESYGCSCSGCGACGGCG